MVCTFYPLFGWFLVSWIFPVWTIIWNHGHFANLSGNFQWCPALLQTQTSFKLWIMLGISASCVTSPTSCSAKLISLFTYCLLAARNLDPDNFFRAPCTSVFFLDGGQQDLCAQKLNTPVSLGGRTQNDKHASSSKNNTTRSVFLSDKILLESAGNW